MAVAPVSPGAFRISRISVVPCAGSASAAIAASPVRSRSARPGHRAHHGRRLTPNEPT